MKAKNNFIKTPFYSILIWAVLIACICPPARKFEEYQKNEFEHSNCVFIAHVYEISPDKHNIKVEIKEVFKGDLPAGLKLTFQNNYSCEPFIGILGDWILYGNVKNNEFIVNDCGVSRSLIHPEQSRFFKPSPPPPPPSTLKDSISVKELRAQWEQLLIESKEIAKFKTEEELTRLRNQ